MFKKNSWILVILFTLLPFVIISFFNLPIGDDFYFGSVGNKNSVTDAITFWYNNWGGRYTQETLLTIFNPISFGSLDFFWLPPLLLIILICVVVFLLIKSVSGKKLEKLDLMIVWTSLIFLIFNLMPEIGETLYWISGAYTFQSGNIFFITIVAIIFQLKNNCSFFKTFALSSFSIVLIFLIAGTNEVAMAYQFGFSILYIFFCYFSKNRNIYMALFLFLFVGIASYLSIAAPGNFIRANATGGIIQNVPKAILESAIRGSFYLVFWLPSAILVASIIWKQIGLVASNFSKTETSKKEFYLILLLFLIIIYAGFFPSLVATGWNPPRSVAPVFIVFLLFFFGILIHYYNFINALFPSFNLNLNNKYLILILVLALSNRHNIMNAYVDIVSLKVVKHTNQVDSLYKELATSKKDTVFVMPLFSKPYTLPVRWPDHYNHLVNAELELYFNKKVQMKPNL